MFDKFRFFDKSFLIFAMAGLGTTTIYIGTFSSLYYLLHTHHLVAITFAFIIAALFQFSVNRKITFKVRDQNFSMQLFRYSILLLINYCISVFILQLSIYFFGSHITGLIITSGITPITGYLLFKYWVFPDLVASQDAN